MTRKLYLFADAPLSGTAQVLDIDLSGKQHRIVLSNTLFHVKGGGQLPDFGSIGDAHVTDVRHGADGTVDHFVDDATKLAIGEIVTLAVDADRRTLNTKLHTAGHLIAGVLIKPFPGMVPLGAHHYPGECRVEFSGSQGVVEELRSQLPALLSAAIAHDYEVQVLGNPEINRTIAIGDYAPIPCGGTHLHKIGVLEKIDIVGIKFKDGRLRVSYEL